MVEEKTADLAGNGDRPNICEHDDGLERQIMLRPELQAMIYATRPSGPGLTDLVSRVRMGLTPSSALNSSVRNEPRRSIVAIGKTRHLVDASVLFGLPTHLVQSLVRNSKGGHQARCMAFSTSLFDEGVQHMSSPSDKHSDLAGLQATLLVLQYATINPRSGNVWILSGAVMRSCLELGLHRECYDMSATAPGVIALRRRVFWAAYCMDRSICSTLQRPLSIPDPAINTLLPSLADDIRVASIGASAEIPPQLWPFLRIIQYHQIHSSMIQVHFQGEALAPGTTWEEWLGDMEQKLRSWYQSACSAPGELTEFSLAHGLTILHRPSPRMPQPSQRSLLVAFEAACTAAKCLKEHISSGFFRRPWMAAHHTLETAMIVLYCLRHGMNTITQHFEVQQIFDMTKLFTSNFLAIAGQGWTEVSKCAGVYERLLGPLLEAIFLQPHAPVVSNDSAATASFTTNSPQTLAGLKSTFSAAQDAELARLLYPGPAHLDKLRFGTGRRAEVTSMVPFDWSFFNVDDDYPLVGTNGVIEPGGFENTPDPAGWQLLDHALEFGEEFAGLL
ncbi:hypothetical protein M8818_005839 [Zalaria obscura]|uniref:Uncharacterized protein n=1 Tax=Zalaria obscura TaxID=2024903 RepID=A0ACC3S8Q0_9PEZI